MPSTKPALNATLTINADRLRADFEALSQIGATLDGGITRLALSNEDLQARAWLADRISEAGLSVRDDDAGNLSGLLPCKRKNARTLLIGSHLDSVPNGGKYDGSIGLLSALECLRRIKESKIPLGVHLEMINFTDEEGCWQSLFGSRALTGQLMENYTVDREADHGPFRAALFRAGIRPADVHRAYRDPSTIAGYLELHIEQGARLDAAGIDIGIVTGIVGRTTHEITFLGQASHSGTTELDRRRDALLGAARFINAAYDLWRKRYPEGICNCGNITVSPGKFNLIPDEAHLTIEYRHPHAHLLQKMEEDMVALAEAQAALHNLTMRYRRVQHMPAATMSSDMIQTIEQVCQEMGITHTCLISYAGHDAQMLSGFTRTGMIFVPSVGGISHNPREYTHWEQVVQGANVLLRAILVLGR